jgi:hypothetical protein
MRSTTAVLKTLLLCLLLVGCDALAGPDTVATIQADNALIVAEATSIALAAAADHAAVQGTAAAAMTRAAEIREETLLLRGTVESGLPQNISVAVSNDARRPDLTPGQPWYSLTGLTGFVDPQTGCGVSPQIAFSSDAPVIYMTFVAHNIRPGTPVDVVWSHESTTVHQESMTISNNSSDICMWFSLDPATVNLLPGNWVVRLVEEGLLIGTPMSFTIREADMMDGG